MCSMLTTEQSFHETPTIARLAVRPTNFRQPLVRSTSQPRQMETTPPTLGDMGFSQHLSQSLFLETPSTPQIPMPTSSRTRCILPNLGDLEGWGDESDDESGHDDFGQSDLSPYTPSQESTTSNTMPDGLDTLLTDYNMSENSLPETTYVEKKIGSRSGYLSEDNSQYDSHLITSPAASWPQHQFSSLKSCKPPAFKLNIYDTSHSENIIPNLKGRRSNSLTKRPSKSQMKRFGHLLSSSAGVLRPHQVQYRVKQPRRLTGSVNGGPRKRHLLQFIVELLASEERNQTCVQWVNRGDRIFRIADPEDLTNRWGDYKNNANMSFESLSRSLRLYYAPGKLERIAGRRHQYRLLGNASDWSTR